MALLVHAVSTIVGAMLVAGKLHHRVAPDLLIAAACCRRPLGCRC
ncbi:hypothetical protein ACH5A2_36635 [Streptomyces collinus]